MPKSKDRYSIDKRLQKKSPWYNSIADPLTGADCKIPDETGVETGTLQLVQKFSVLTNSVGVAGFKIQSPYINDNATSNADGASEGSNWQILSQASTAVSLVWGNYDTSTGTWQAQKCLPFDGVAELKSVTDSHRIVSACVMVQPECSLASNKGEFALFASPFLQSSSNQYVDYMNLYKSVTIPVNLNQPGIVRWYPFTRQDLSFKEFLTTHGTTFNTGIYDGTSCPYWNLGFVANGCEADVAFRVTVVINYEFKPVFNTLNVIDASPSPVDVTESELTETWVQELPVAQATTSAKVDRSPSTVAPRHGENDGGTGFGMFFNVIQELAPLALALL